MVGIYRITNQINGKVYIGQSVDIARRWKDHRKAINSDLPLYRAMRKYGKDNFIFEVIEECSQKELDEKEIYWIKFYDSLNPDKGYNLSSGGSNGSHFGKLNYETLKQVKDLLKNSDIMLGDIAKQFKVSLIAIKDINQGHSYYDENEKYPLRPVNVANHCPLCNAIIDRQSKHCIKCAMLLSRKVERPSREELKQLIRTIPFTKIGKMFGVSDNAIRKWCVSYNLPKRSTDIKKYTDEEWERI